MKKLGLLTLALLLGLAVQAQHETLFNNARVVGGFGAPIIEMGLGNDMTTAVGGGGGVVIDNFFIGGYGVGSIDFERLIEDDDIQEIELGHGGFWLGYTLAPHRVLHLYTSARLGWGAVGIDVSDNSSFPDNTDNVFVVTPEIGLELNVTRWFRVAGTVGYRYVDGISDNSPYKSNAFDGTLANLTFRFGWFGWDRDN
ncbi:MULTISPECIES: outer membrane beta-barrel protein [Phaeodactylibacter]|jgi:hypothetical protein|uniref:Outer membrane protein beta-barrel domain-containing protein n=1 Tax=Phaeodactylibacter xiamenensis TaxID=1524460 RepID=A0A098S4W4_9BACT|nr:MULTISPECIES: outer membrane beta-barrel protein [Phaeodactylibacter]KGE87106.1 hypothetical protein IX84_15695 [Phaeodactylibacter xiamenensis]MCI4648841.1 outer membrane beta-barrel protein [Phaeodactylibacter sp.]MCI5093921.1 outer membrane beta-barrel protein [Phaeodactylibacter sp.]MCR9053734.1 outer membrane beta-barrel protein [bacterium]